ncbi:MAG: ATP-dependent RNA helicase, partial [Armatimonadetes bacterium]|nr:ATP-dependent RNA helicase [Armatimonadota bacterium]
MERSDAILSALPIEALRPGVEALVGRSHLVVGAPTGSGKSTRIPAWCADVTGKPVLVVEPRRVACRSLARWVAAQRGERPGEGVGYTVRFEDVAGAETRIRYVTPGIALQYAAGRGLEGYGTLILDEFHERGLETDIFLAVARRLRPDARLIVMSATLDGRRLARHLDGEWLQAEGRVFPVPVRYLGGPTVPSPWRLAERVAEGVRRALAESDGSVLVFLPGKGEIADCLSRLQGLKGVEVLPLHGTLTNEEQDRAFDAAGRRVILATNVAETSITLPGITAVVDSGLVRQRVHQGGHSALAVVPVSHASSEQRRGRAGRVAPGTCYRLWDERARLEPDTPPQVLREDLMAFVLAVAATGFRPQELEFLDAPPAFAVARAREQLRAWDALDRDDRLTEFGRRLFAVPVDAALARLLLQAPPEQRRDLADLAAALESRAPLFRRGSPEENDDDGDALPRCDGTRMILAIRRAYPHPARLHHDALAECRRIADQLRDLFDLPSLADDPGPTHPDRPALVRALLSQWPERAYVRRRSGDAWGNGRDEVRWGGERRPGSGDGRRGAGRRRRRPQGTAGEAPEAQAAILLDIEAIGDRGVRTELRARHAMPCAFADLRAAGLGVPRAERPALVEGQVVADVTIEYAGREIDRETRPLTGALLRQ